VPGEGTQRRWEAYLGPLFARLGINRPDLNPVNLEDAARTVALVGDYRYGGPSPGCRRCMQAGLVPAPAAGRFATWIFSPPAGGAWLTTVLVVGDGGSAFRIGTSNQVTTPGVVPTGTTQRSFRPDNREPYPSLLTQTQGDGLTLEPFARVVGALAWNPGLWWVGTNIIVQIETAAEGGSAVIEFEPPLEGITRTVGTQ
jgi:hypothetical protein